MTSTKMMTSNQAQALTLVDETMGINSVNDSKDAKGKEEKTSATSNKDEKKDKLANLALDSEEGKPLKLVAKDKKAFNIKEKKWAFISTLVKTSLENDEAATEVPIPGCTGPILELIVEYLDHHKGVEPPIIEKPLRSKVLKGLSSCFDSKVLIFCHGIDVCSDKWDAQYIDAIGDNRQNLYDLILAANYCDIKSLLHLSCAKVFSSAKSSMHRVSHFLTGR